MVKRSQSLIKPKPALNQITISSARRDRCIAQIEAAASVSSAKSRADTASSELAMGRSKPSSAAVMCRSMGKDVPASAAAPSGDSFTRSLRIGKPAPVARQHLDIGEAMMAEGDGLRGLHMREARHQRARMGLRLPRQRKLQARDLAVDMIDGAPDIQPEIGRHLIVARARGVQLARNRPDQLLEPRLHRHVDVLIFAAELEAALRDLGADGIEPRRRWPRPPRP